jgi:heterodisulfide reductase subunit A
MSSRRSGVFVCHCGTNIAATVDVKKVTADAAADEGVVFAKDYVYMCSDPGQQSIIDAIKDHKLDNVVISCCSPNLHEKTFREASALGGMNSFQCEIANIREQCAWVHKDKEKATEKAIKITRSAIRRARRDESLKPIGVPVTRKVMVIGGGIAGIQSALDLANAGLDVVLVEKQPTIGGHMIQLSETFPTLDCSQCILSPKMVEVSKHPKITLMVQSEVKSISGFVGNFKVKVNTKAQFVDPEKCKICDDCAVVCPVVATNEYDEGLTGRRAIHMPFAQAIPATYTLDESACLGLNPVVCGKCKKACEAGAINYDLRPTSKEIEVGAIVVATGFDLYGKDQLGEFGHGRYPDVLDGLQFERLCSASGPTEGHVLRPSDQTVPKKVVFIQCSGSRDPEQHCAYCSKICCMYTAKHTMLYKHKVHDGQAHVFYMDIRSAGKGYDEFVRRAIEQDGAKYYRGRVSKITEQDGKLIVRGADTLAGTPITVEADLVVLAAAMRPADGVTELAQKLNVGYDQFGFLMESHPKLRPVETNTAGVYICGAAQAPKDIPESVAQASAAASKVQITLAASELTREPEIAHINETTCAACFRCYEACPYHAIEKAEVRNRKGALVKRTARVNVGLCMGCGTCVSVCPSKSADIEGFTEQETYAMIESLI